MPSTMAATVHSGQTQVVKLSFKLCVVAYAIAMSAFRPQKFRRIRSNKKHFPHGTSRAPRGTRDWPSHARPKYYSNARRCSQAKREWKCVVFALQSYFNLPNPSDFSSYGEAPPFPSPSGRGPTSAAVCTRGVRGSAGQLRASHKSKLLRVRLLLRIVRLLQILLLLKLPFRLRVLLAHFLDPLQSQPRRPHHRSVLVLQHRLRSRHDRRVHQMPLAQQNIDRHHPHGVMLVLQQFQKFRASFRRRIEFLQQPVYELAKRFSERRSQHRRQRFDRLDAKFRQRDLNVLHLLLHLGAERPVRLEFNLQNLRRPLLRRPPLENRRFLRESGKRNQRQQYDRQRAHGRDSFRDFYSGRCPVSPNTTRESAFYC